MIQYFCPRFVRFLRVTGAGNDGVFVSSQVWAEMRKSTCYKIDISINRDGVVQEAQCECGAGQGPTAHCKHIAAVLFGLSCFCSTGEVLTELTCTQVKIFINPFQICRCKQNNVLKHESLVYFIF